MNHQKTGAIIKQNQNERTTTITTTGAYSITSSVRSVSYSTNVVSRKSLPDNSSSNKTKVPFPEMRKTSISALDALEDISNNNKKPEIKYSYSLPRIPFSSHSTISEDKQFQNRPILSTSNPFITEFNSNSGQNLSSDKYSYVYESPYSGNKFTKVQPSQTKPSFISNTQTNGRTVSKTNENNKLGQRFPEQNSQQSKKVFSTMLSYVKNKSSLKEPGICFIFNHENFDSSKEDYRSGTQHDVNLLKETFQSFNVNVKVFKDLTVNGIHAEIKKIEKMNLKNYSCIVITILSHGNRQGMIKAKDGYYLIDDHVLFPILRNQSLAKKPKILIIQACKGNMLSIDSEIPQQFIFTKARPDEVVKFYSTFEGYVSFREESGSIFIRKFCYLLKEFGKTKYIKEIMEMVIAAVQNETRGLQTPSISTTMTKSYIFGDHI